MKKRKALSLLLSLVLCLGLFTVPAMAAEDDDMAPFLNGLAMVMKHGADGRSFADKAGKVAVPLEYNCAKEPEFCTNRGNSVTPGVKFCPKCGQPIQGGKD